MVSSLICSAVLGTGVLSAQAKGPMLIVDDLVIGTLEGSQWVMADKPLKMDKEFMGHKVGLLNTSKMVKSEGLLWSDGVFGNFLKGDRFFDGVIWTGAKPKYPRIIASLKPDSWEYRKIVRDVVKLDNKFKIDIGAVLRVDLDGDGTEEMVIAASHPGLKDSDMYEPKEGMFSCVLIYGLSGSETKTHVIASQVIGGEIDFMEKFELKSVADFDGDGKYEVVTGTEYYEGRGAVVSGFEKGKVVEKLAFGAGA